MIKAKRIKLAEIEEAVIVNLFTNGLSIRQIAFRQSRSTHTVRRILKKSDEKTDKRTRRDDAIIFNGKRYTKQANGYWRCHYYKVKTYLHRDVFEFHTGRKIKDGHQINHMDHDKDNNAFENLQELEASEHSHETGHWNRNRGGSFTKCC